MFVTLKEMEKALSGAASSAVTDGGTSARVLGGLLYWLNEQNSGAYVIGTCNDASKLPAAVMRSGRFDSVWWVDLPEQESIVEILNIHLALRNRDPKNFDLESLATITYRPVGDDDDYLYSGSEWEEAVKSGLIDAFFHEREITTEDIRAAIARTIPLSYMKRDEMRTAEGEWGVRAQQASPNSPMAKRLQQGRKEEDAVASLIAPTKKTIEAPVPLPPPIDPDILGSADELPE